MGNIVVIEPHRILQQAIALSLARDHNIQVRESMTGPELRGLKECDLLVVDAASLTDKKLLTADLLRALQSSATPMLWIENDQSLERPEREKFQVLKTPLEHKAFKDAVANLLAPQSGPRREAQDQKLSTSGKDSSKSEENKKAAKDSEQRSSEFIDLIEVVAEAPSGGGEKTSRKSN